MNKKYIALLATTAVVATSLFSLSAFADTQAPAPATNAPTTQNQGMKERFGMFRNGKDMANRGMVGTVTSVNGTTFTISVKSHTKKSAPVVAPTVYTVDASKATFVNKAANTTTVSVGDVVMVMGSVTGTNITATRIVDGLKINNGSEINDQKTAPLFPGNGQPVVAGSVTAISGNTVTITNNSNDTYTIDTTTAKIEKAGVASTAANIAVGDMLVAQGSVNGTSVTAVTIMDSGAKTTTTTTENTKPKGFFGKIGNFFGSVFGF